MSKQTRPSLATRLYALLMRLYPRRLRREDGEDMREMFDDIYQYEPESRGPAGRARLAGSAVRDVLGGAFAARLPFLDVLRQDLRYGLRRLRINPTLTVAAVLTLAVGIGSVTAIYSFVDGLVLHPLAYPEVDRVVAIGEVTPRRPLDGEGWIHGYELGALNELDALDAAAGMGLFLTTMTGVGDPVEVIGWRTTPEFFAVARARPLHGRGFSGSAADSDTVVLAFKFWQSRFGSDPGVIGRTLQLGGTPMTVIGVMPRGAEFPMGTDLWVPQRRTSQELASHDGQLRTIARLAPDATIEQLRAQLAGVAAASAERAPEQHQDMRFAVEPILANMTVNTRAALGFLMGAAGFLLLLVCGNVANMQLAQAAARRAEMAMRQALGAPRGRLVRQLLTESVALAALAGGAGTLLAVWCARGLRAALAHERWRFYFAGVDNVGINGSVLAFTAAVSLGSVILFGLVPALRGSRVDLNQALKQSLTGGTRRRNGMRRSLVVLEVALSIVLLVAAGLMAASIGALTRYEPGIDTSVLTVRLRLPASGYQDDAQRARFFEQAVTQAAAVPGVTSAALAARIPATSSSRGRPVEVESGPAAEAGSSAVRVERHAVAGDYFDTLDISLRRGSFAARDFAPSRALDTPTAAPAEEAAPGSVVVGAALAERLWPGGSALGQRLRFADDEPWLTVSGVAADVATAWNDPRPSASVYVPFTPARDGYLLLDIEGDATSALGLLRDRVRSLEDAVVIFAPESVSASIDAVASPVRSMNRLVAGIALAALIVCLSGIYALVAHTTGQRRREIGVRMALGARDKQVVRMLVAHGLATVAVGLVIGLAGAFALARVLAGFLAGMLTVDGRVFLALGAGMLLLAALSSWLPARRAARIDPATTLRAD